MALADGQRSIQRHFSVASLLSPTSDGLSVVRDNARIPTGMDPLDRMFGGGFRLGDFVLLGGRPGVGKTIAALQWARSMAMSGAATVFVSYEHDERTLLGRLVAMEIGMLEVGEAHADTNSLISGVLNGELSGATDVGRHPLVRAAVAKVGEYAAHLTLLPAARLRLDVEGLKTAYSEVEADRKALVVDYLQKVPAGGDSGWDLDGARIVAERMKELALATESTVVGVSAVDEVGLQRRRVGLSHLRSAAALSHEADVAVLLNDKSLVTSKVHVAYDLTRIEEFERQVVFSIEKNRSGRAKIDLEFEKDFGHYRFLPEGRFVAEALIDGVAVEN